MKIAFIVHLFPELSQSFVINQITGLLDIGHDVRIFADRNPQESEVHNDVLEYKLAERTEYISLPENKNICRLNTFCLLLLYMFRNPAVISRALLELLRRKEGFAYRLLYYAFKFHRNDYDIIHCHFGPAGNIGAFLKKAGITGKLVTTFHGYDITTYVRKMGSGVYKDLFDCGDMFTYNSNATRKKILDLGCPPERMTKVQMGIHLDRFKFVPRSPGPDNLIRILSVGRLVEMKGREYAIKAFAKVAKNNPDIRYDIVGDGILRQSLENLIEELDMTDKIRIHQWVSTEKLESLYKQSHIFLHPSVVASDGNMEGQGVVLVEAQAVGLPVLATKHNAFTETVPDGRSGFLVPEKDTDALAEKLEYLILHPEVWDKMGKCGRDFVCQNYDIKVLNKRLIGIYSKLLSAKD